MEIRRTTSGQRPGDRWHKVTRGAHREAEAPDPWLASLHAWTLVLPEDARFTGLTAARLHGLWLPEVPVDLPIEVRIDNRTPRPRRPSLKVHRSVHLHPAQRRSGLPVDPVETAPQHVCRYAAHLDALLLVDSALTVPGVTMESLRPAAGTLGARRLREVLCHADPRTESPWESILREFHRVVEATVVPQHETYDDQGNWLARGDLWFPGTKVLHEYDGGVHLTRKQQREDLRRSRRLTNAGWERRGYTAQDVVQRAAGVLRDVDRTLQREHVPGRLEQWYALLRESCVTSAGKERLVRALR